MSQKEKISEVLVLVGVAAFIFYKYSKMTAGEKEKVHDDLKEIGEKVIKGFIPGGIKEFLPAAFK